MKALYHFRFKAKSACKEEPDNDADQILTNSKSEQARLEANEMHATGEEEDYNIKSCWTIIKRNLQSSRMKMTKTVSTMELHNDHFRDNKTRGLRS